MRIFGLTIARIKAAVVDALSPVSSRGGGWWPIIRESFTGAWQRNVEIRQQDVLTYSTVWACITLIAADIAKLWIKLVVKDADGICTETENPAFSPVLRKPNHFQTRVKFFEYWIISKLVHGNTYVLKERNNRGGEDNGNVTALYILDPQCVTVLVAPDGSVFYQLQQDNLAGIDEAMAGVPVPASEIIHDIMVPLYHPLVGVSPIFACGLAALQGLKIQNQSSKLFARGSQLSGVLTAPGTISNENAARLQAWWDANFMGEENVGKVAALGDGLKFEPMTMTAVDAQLIEQLKWTAETVCSCFHVPGYKVGIGSPPPYTDIQSMELQYYNQALQNPIENLETLLDEGLELPRNPEYHVELDLKALLRMDTRTQTSVLKDQISAGFLKINEARAELDLLPVEGGDTCYLQQQNFSLKALNRRDESWPTQSAGTTTGGDGVPNPDNTAMNRENDFMLLELAAEIANQIAVTA